MAGEKPDADRKAILGWAFYDWANSAFATTVMAGFFPVFFKSYWSRGIPPTVSTFWLGVTVSSASLCAAVLASLVGAAADRAGSLKRSLVLCAACGALATAGLCGVGSGAWPLAATLYGVATLAFLGSLVFYDALLPGISRAATVDTVSALGYGLGYLGGGLLFLFNVICVSRPGWFGLPGPDAAVRLSFLTVALWWGVFTVPLVLFVPERTRVPGPPLAASLRGALRRLGGTLREAWSLPSVGWFLLAYWFYIDGVDTVILMAVDYGKALGFGTTELITALLLVQFIAFPFACLAGWVSRRWGTRRTLMACLGVYTAVAILGSGLAVEPYRLFGLRCSRFYALAALVAMVQGGTQALSRAYFAKLIPADRSGEFFGLYNMLGKFAAILGPVLVGSVARLTGSPRAGIGAIALLFIVGAGCLWRTTEHGSQGRRGPP
jgi:UMF1 family MFS transporter